MVTVGEATEGSMTGRRWASVHPNAPALGGVDGTVTHFAIDGNPLGGGRAIGGGLLRFDLRTRWHRGDPKTDEGGIGMIDCATGRLKEVVITG